MDGADIPKGPVSFPLSPRRRLAVDRSPEERGQSSPNLYTPRECVCVCGGGFNQDVELLCAALRSTPSLTTYPEFHRERILGCQSPEQLRPIRTSQMTLVIIYTTICRWLAKAPILPTKRDKTNRRNGGLGDGDSGSSPSRMRSARCDTQT